MAIFSTVISSTRRLSRRLPRKTIKLAIVECETQWKVWNVFICIFFKPRALFPVFIVVLSKYHTNKTSNWIIQYSRFDLKNRKMPFICLFLLPFFRFKNKSEKPKNDSVIWFFWLCFKSEYSKNEPYTDSVSNWKNDYNFQLFNGTDLMHGL